MVKEVAGGEEDGRKRDIRDREKAQQLKSWSENRLLEEELDEETGCGSQVGGGWVAEREREIEQQNTS